MYIDPHWRLLGGRERAARRTPLQGRALVHRAVPIFDPNQRALKNWSLKNKAERLSPSTFHMELAGSPLDTYTMAETSAHACNASGLVTFMVGVEISSTNQGKNSNFSKPRKSSPCRRKCHWEYRLLYHPAHEQLPPRSYTPTPLKPRPSLRSQFDIARIHSICFVLETLTK